MAYNAPIRMRKALLLAIAESTPGVDASPTLSNAVYCEVASQPINPNAGRITTDYATASLDQSNNLIEGIKASMTVTIPLMSPNAPGVLPDFDVLMSGCGFAGTATKTDYVASTISITGTNTISDSGSGLAAFTVGTEITVTGEATNGNFCGVVTASAAGALTITRVDGTAPALTNVTAGQSITVRRGIPGTAATTASTATAATLAAPYAATAELYRHWPLLVSGNPATPQYTTVQDYTVGRLATLADTFGSALTTSSIVSAPANVVYAPTSAAANLKNLTLYLYVDGTLWKMFGAVGNWKLDCNAAGLSRMTFEFQGVFGGKTDSALLAYTPPTGYTPPVFRSGYCAIQRNPVSPKVLSISANSTIVYPPNPNAASGFDPPIVTSRKFSGSINPQAGLVASDTSYTAFANSTTQMICARFGQNSAPGNRFSLTIPSAFLLDTTPSNDSAIMRNTLQFECQNPDAAAFGLAIY